MCICESAVEKQTTVTKNEFAVSLCDLPEKISWRATRSIVGGKLYGVRCGWCSDKRSGFKAVKAITPNGDIMFHSAEMADIAVHMIKSYAEYKLEDLPISAYIKVGTSAVKLFSGSYEFANAFHAHWQGTSIVQNLIIVHSGSASDEFMNDRCQIDNDHGNALVINVREFFTQSSSIDADQRRINQLRVDLTSQCVINKLTLEDRGIVSSWKKVCESFGFKGARLATSQESTHTTDIRSKRENHSNKAGGCDLPDILRFEPLRKVDLFKLAKKKQQNQTSSKGKQKNTTTPKTDMSSGLFSQKEITRIEKRKQTQIDKINKIKTLPENFKFNVIHLKEKSELFLLQVLDGMGEAKATIPLKTIKSVKAMADLIVEDFKCDRVASFKTGTKCMYLTVCQASGFGREDSVIFVGNDKQIDFFYNEWENGVFSSSVGVAYSTKKHLLSMDTVKHRINTIKDSLSSVYIGNSLSF